MHRANVTGAGTSLDFVGTGNGVAAFKEHVVGHEFATAVDNHLDRVVAAIGDGGKQIGVVDAEAIAQAVFNEEFLAVLDALSLLYRIAGAGQRCRRRWRSCRRRRSSFQASERADRRGRP